MQRRDLLKLTGGLALKTLAGYSVLTPALLRSAFAAPNPSIAELVAELKPDEGELLVPTHSLYQSRTEVYNLRTKLANNTHIRFWAKSKVGIEKAVAWALRHKVPFVSRSGGHSYEGLSQSERFVIDLRGMQKIAFDPANSIVDVDAGCSLGQVYLEISKANHAIPAGTCPSVGITGHVLGGGVGMLVRPLGLACDSLLSVEMVDARGTAIVASERENADLFWALRGGGQDNFGVVTKLRFKTHKLGSLHWFRIQWMTDVNAAARLMAKWQSWAPSAPKEISSIFKFQHAGGGKISLTLIGQTIGKKSDLAAELNSLTNVLPTPVAIQPATFLQSVFKWAGIKDEDKEKLKKYDKEFMKGKSDYVKKPISSEGLLQLMQNIKALPANEVVLMCDAYGGAISAGKKDSDTAFAHREDTLYSIQWASFWSKAADSARRVQNLNQLYAKMRPHMSGGAYVNYCDLEIRDWEKAYWGENVERLKDIKRKYDRDNVFAHPQSLRIT